MSWHYLKRLLYKRPYLKVNTIGCFLSRHKHIKITCYHRINLFLLSKFSSFIFFHVLSHTALHVTSVKLVFMYYFNRLSYFSLRYLLKDSCLLDLMSFITGNILHFLFSLSLSLNWHLQFIQMFLVNPLFLLITILIFSKKFL